MFRKICGLMFALLISVSVFAIDFDVIRGRYESDSLGLDSAAYVAVLQRMYTNENENRQHYVELNDSVGVAECQMQMRAIVVELLSLSGADEAELDDIEADKINGLWYLVSLPVVAGLEGLRRWRVKRKAKKEAKDAVV